MQATLLAQYIKDFRSTGAIASSSRYLARKMLANIDFDSAKVIVEYGPGTGVFTREIINRKKPDTKLIIIESNKTFHSKLTATIPHDPSVIIVHDSAANIAAILQAISITQPVDVIVSGLPFAGLPKELSEKILSESKKAIHSNGMFVTFQYTLLKKSFLHRYFKHLNVTREIRNIPPAYVFELSDTEKN